eukprot:499588-Amphidinium_carterae.2
MEQNLTRSHANHTTTERAKPSLGKSGHTRLKVSPHEYQLCNAPLPSTKAPPKSILAPLRSRGLHGEQGKKKKNVTLVRARHSNMQENTRPSQFCLNSRLFSDCLNTDLAADRDMWHKSFLPRKRKGSAESVISSATSIHLLQTKGYATTSRVAGLA